jgi:hypothetical protein
LRETYRIDAAAHPHVHEDCAAVLAKLGLDAPATLYWASDGAMNAALCFVPGEIHLLKGNITVKSFETNDRAKREATKLIADKVCKGYVEV